MIYYKEPLKNHLNLRKSRFINQNPFKIEQKEENEENEKDMEERIKSIKRRHTLIGKKNYDDHELAKIDLNCLFLTFYFFYKFLTYDFFKRKAIFKNFT